jgi:hypothetical protein
MAHKPKKKTIPQKKYSTLAQDKLPISVVVTNTKQPTHKWYKISMLIGVGIIVIILGVSYYYVFTRNLLSFFS